MTKTRVLVVDPRADWYASELASRFPEVEVTAARTFVDADGALADAEVVVTIGSVVVGAPLTAEVVERMPALRWVQCLISGSEHIERAVAARDDVIVSTTVGIHGPQMSELAILSMLALGRGYRTMLRNQEARVWDRIPQRILAGKTIGIAGLGTIGMHLAPLCKAFGTTVYGFSRAAREVPGVDRVFDRSELVRVAPELDFLVVLVPATEETRGFVDARLLEAMKPGAYLVNLSRGSVVDEDALLAALRSGSIAGAALDVFATEPLPEDSPLWELENVIVTPHQGGPHVEYAEQTLQVLEPNLRAYLDGDLGAMRNVVRSAAA